MSPALWAKRDGLLMSTPCLKTWTDERVSSVTRQMRRQEGRSGPKVTRNLRKFFPQIVFVLTCHSDQNLKCTFQVPRTTWVITDHLVRAHGVVPQLLMHEVGISRLKRRFADMEDELDEVLTNVGNLIRRITARLENLESKNC